MASKIGRTSAGELLITRRISLVAACCRRALELKPDFADAEVAMGYVQEELGQFDAAAASYRRALKIRPDYGEAYSNLGNSLRSLGQLDAALAMLSNCAADPAACS